MFCHHCGTRIDESVICSKCGEKHSTKSIDLSKNNRAFDCNYNIFEHIMDSDDIPTLVDELMQHNVGLVSDRTFISAEVSLITSIIWYLYKEAPKNEWVMFMVIELLENSLIENEEAGDYSNYDLLINHLTTIDPSHPSIAAHQSFKNKANHSINEVVQSCIARMTVFDDLNCTPSLRQIFA